MFVPLLRMSNQNFWQELKRRNVYRVAVNYAVVAWLLLQVASILLPTFEAPNWIMQVITIVLIIGFPIALIMAWIYELSPSGLKRTDSSEVPGPTSKTFNKSRLYNNVFIGVLLVALIGQFVYFKFIISEEGNNRHTNEANRHERIAVVPFQNLTNDETHDNFGKIAANFINLSLMDAEEAEVLSPATVQNNLAAIGILPGDAAGRKSFPELTGADIVLGGSYFENESRLTLAIEIQDARTGNLRYAFPHVSGSSEEKEAIITEATEKVQGYWLARDLIDDKRIRLPNLDAYNLFLNRETDGFSYERLEEIISIDSTFYLARIHWLNFSRWFRHEAKPAHFDFLDRHVNDLTKHEAELYDFVKTLYQGTSIQTFRKANAIYQRFPSDFSLNHDAAGIAMDRLNNCELCLQIYDEVTLDRSVNVLITVGQGRIRNEIFCRGMLNGNNAILDANLDKLARDIDMGTNSKYYSTLVALMTSDESAYHELLHDEFDQVSEAERAFLILPHRFEKDFRSVFSSSLMHDDLIEIGHRYLAKFKEASPGKTLVATILTVIEGNGLSSIPDWEYDIDFYGPYSFYHRYLYWKALGSINDGDMNSVESIIDELEQYIVNDLTIPASFASYPFYHISCIYSQAGNRDKALEYLKKARENGLYASHYHYQNDTHLSKLFEDEQFREIVAPIWPEE